MISGQCGAVDCAIAARPAWDISANSHFVMIWLCWYDFKNYKLKGSAYSIHCIVNMCYNGDIINVCYACDHDLLLTRLLYISPSQAPPRQTQTVIRDTDKGPADDLAEWMTPPPCKDKNLLSQNRTIYNLIHPSFIGSFVLFYQDIFRMLQPYSTYNWV